MGLFKKKTQGPVEPTTALDVLKTKPTPEIPEYYEVIIKPRDGAFAYTWQLKYKYQYMTNGLARSEAEGLKKAKAAIKTHEERIAHLSRPTKIYTPDGVKEN
jgi:hypothetical protein